MPERNPYMKAAQNNLPTKPYQITFLPMGVKVQVDPDKLPYTRNGKVGSILEISGSVEQDGVEIEHSCGGVCACSTCHVIVREGIAGCSEPDDEELDQLEEAPGLEMNSRLACQCVPDGSCNLVVEVPNWNRNAVKEDPHDPLSQDS